MVHSTEAPTPTPLERVRRWLKALPADETIIWMSQHDTHEDVHTGWIDVEVPTSGLGLDWIWTVTGGSDLSLTTDDELDITVPYDVVVWHVFDPTAGEYLTEPYRISARGDDDVDDDPSFAAAAAQVNGRISTDGGWTATAVSAAVAAWIREHTGRTDLTVVHEPGPSPLRLADEHLSADLERRLRLELH